MTTSGECFCGRITYQIRGQLRDARSCHCSRCRKAFSSQASAYALVKPDDFEWLSGHALLTSYIGEQGFGYSFVGNVVRLFVVFMGAKYMELH